MDFGAVGNIVYEEVWGHYREHSCITASAVLVDALRVLGVDGAFPLSVKVQIYNPALARRVGDIARNPPSEATLRKWLQTRGSFMVGIGIGESGPDEWPGHLVVIAPNALNGRNLLFDLAIPRANQPQHEINLPPLAFVAPPGFEGGKQPFMWRVKDCCLLYRAHPDDLSFEDTPAWRNTAEHDLVVTRAVTRILETA